MRLFSYSLSLLTFCAIFPSTTFARDPVLFALEQAARDIQAGVDPSDVVDQTMQNMRASEVSTPRGTWSMTANPYDGNRVTVLDVKNYGNDLETAASRQSGHAMYWHAEDGRRARIDATWPLIDPYDPNNPCHRGILERARTDILEEVVHAFEDGVGPREALKYTPAYEDYLKRTGTKFDSEAYAYAFMEEHLGIKPEVEQIMRYDERAPYFLHRNPDLVPGNGAGEIPSRPVPGPEFTRPSEAGIELDDTCLKRLEKLKEVGEAAPTRKTGRLAEFGKVFKGKGKLMRGGGRVVAIAGGAAGALGIINLVFASGKGAALGYAEAKANQQRNDLMWDLYHDPAYAGDPRYDNTRTGSTATQGVNPKLRRVMDILSDSLWGNIELGPSIVDVVP